MHSDTMSEYFDTNMTQPGVEMEAQPNNVALGGGLSVVDEVSTAELRNKTDGQETSIKILKDLQFDHPGVKSICTNSEHSISWICGRCTLSNEGVLTCAACGLPRPRVTKKKPDVLHIKEKIIPASVVESCSKTTLLRSPGKLVEHVLEEGEDVRHYCDVCNRSFFSEPFLNYHLTGQSHKQRLLEHAKSSDETMPSCDVPLASNDASLSMRSSSLSETATFADGLNAHGMVEQHSCAVCAKGFVASSYLRAHLRGQPHKQRVDALVSVEQPLSFYEIVIDDHVVDAANQRAEKDFERAIMLGSSVGSAWAKYAAGFGGEDVEVAGESRGMHLPTSTAVNAFQLDEYEESMVSRFSECLTSISKTELPVDILSLSPDELSRFPVESILRANTTFYDATVRKAFTKAENLKTQLTAVHLQKVALDKQYKELFNRVTLDVQAYAVQTMVPPPLPLPLPPPLLHAQKNVFKKPEQFVFPHTKEFYTSHVKSFIKPDDPIIVRPVLRFSLNTRVFYNSLSGWRSGNVVRVWDSNNPYRIRDDLNGTEVWAPKDDDAYVRIWRVWGI